MTGNCFYSKTNYPESMLWESLSFKSANRPQMFLRRGWWRMYVCKETVIGHGTTQQQRKPCKAPGEDYPKHRAGSTTVGTPLREAEGWLPHEGTAPGGKRWLHLTQWLLQPRSQDQAWQKVGVPHVWLEKRIWTQKWNVWCFSAIYITRVLPRAGWIIHIIYLTGFSLSGRLHIKA